MCTVPAAIDEYVILAGCVDDGVAVVVVEGEGEDCDGGVWLVGVAFCCMRLN